MGVWADQCFLVGGVDLWRTWRHSQRQCTVPHINYVDNVNFDGTQVSALYTNVDFGRRINKRCIGYHVWSVSLCKQSCSLCYYRNAGECFVLLYCSVPSLLQVKLLLFYFFLFIAAFGLHVPKKSRASLIPNSYAHWGVRLFFVVVSPAISPLLDRHQPYRQLRLLHLLFLFQFLLSLFFLFFIFLRAVSVVC